MQAQLRPRCCAHLLFFKVAVRYRERGCQLPSLFRFRRYLPHSVFRRYLPTTVAREPSRFSPNPKKVAPCVSFCSQKRNIILNP